MLGELWSSRKFEGNFLSHPKVLSILMGLVESSRRRSTILSLENIRGHFFLNYVTMEI